MEMVPNPSGCTRIIIGGINTWTPKQPDAIIYFDDINALMDHELGRGEEKQVVCFVMVVCISDGSGSSS